jgi:alanine racemase
VRPSWIEIDLGAIRANVAEIRRVVAPSVVCAVVKADGYGHGDVPAAEAALAGGAEWLAVAMVEEGCRLREAGIDAPILLLSEPPDGDAAGVVRWQLTPTVYTRHFAEALSRAATEAPHPVHLKVDTGMHRVGADPGEAARIARYVADEPHLRLEGVWTHFAVAEEDAEFTDRQSTTLAAFVADLRTEGIDPPIVHAANTAGALGTPAARFDLVRVGLGIYGLRPDPDPAPDVPLRPAMRVVSQVSLVRQLPAGARPSYGRRRPLRHDAAVATVPLGYADGVARRLSSVGGEVLIGGRRRPYAGTVTMDQIVVDVGADDVAVGDEVVLIGEQGDEAITADEWARLLDTINYEIVCDFGPRLPRRYRQADADG